MSHMVLFVDDDLGVLQALVRRLRKEPYELRTATSAEEAPGAFGRGPVDLVVCGWHMPGMTGTEFLAKVAAEYPNCVRILLTGEASLPVAVGAINNGEVYRFLTKPFDANALAGVIREALRDRAAPLPAGASPPAAAPTAKAADGNAREPEAAGQFADGVAAEFDQVVMAINGYCTILLADANVVGPVRESVRQIKKASERGLTLTRQLLSPGEQQRVARGHEPAGVATGEGTDRGPKADRVVATKLDRR